MLTNTSQMPTAGAVESFAAEMVEQIKVGDWNTDVRAGIIGEIRCQAPWTDLEKRVMAVAALACSRLGLP